MTRSERCIPTGLGDSESMTLIVLGNGWSALGAVAGALAHGDTSVVWIQGSGARLQSPTASLQKGPGQVFFAEMLRAYGITEEPAESGSYLREFRNKSFREMPWNRAPSPQARREVRDEWLWGPERTFAGGFELRWPDPVDVLESRLRLKVLEAPADRLRVIADNPVTEFKLEARPLVVLGSGETVEADRLLFADRWGTLAAIPGLPRPLPFLKGTAWVGALQATFTHAPPVAVGVQETFCSVLNKDAGEEMERRVWGYFDPSGRSSSWTIALAEDETEDNHLIAKKLRRLKQALDKAFSGESFGLPEGQVLTQTIASEQVRFEAGVLSDGKLVEKLPGGIATLPKSRDRACFITDGLGFTSAWEQSQLALAAFGLWVMPEPQTEADSFELQDASAVEHGTGLA